MTRRPVVFFHAHPDDEAIATGGVMLKAAREGWRVVLVVATKGEHAGVGLELLEPGESLGERRVQETHAAAGRQSTETSHEPQPTP